MKTNYLFPNRFKKLGWVLLIPSSIIGFISLIYGFEPSYLDFQVPAIQIDNLGGKKQLFAVVPNNLLNEITGVLVILGALLVAFSKEKLEDEYLSKLRLESLVWAVYLNYAILLFSFLFVYDLSFLWIMIFNMFTILIFFIVRFNLSVAKLNTSSYEE